MKKLGLIGGTGPESTHGYYREVISGVQNAVDKETLPRLVIESLSVFQVMEYCSNRDFDGLTEYLSESAQNLVAAGAEVVSLTALTPHIVFDRLAEQTSVPVVSAMTATVDELKRQDVKKVALLGTKFTMKEDFFRVAIENAGIQVEIPTDDEIEYIQDRIITELEHGVVRDDTRQGFIKIIERMHQESGVEQVILGCTELPLILDESNSPIPCVDPVQVHTAALVREIID